MNQRNVNALCASLLSDMRRKYLHARAHGHDAEWLRGSPLTARILERWIPQVEAMQSALQSVATEVNRYGGISEETLQAVERTLPTPGQLREGVNANLVRVLAEMERLGALSNRALVEEALAGDAADFEIVCEMMRRLDPGWETRIDDDPIKSDVPVAPTLCGHDDGGNCDETCAEKARKFRAWYGFKPRSS